MLVNKNLFRKNDVPVTHLLKACAVMSLVAFSFVVQAQTDAKKLSDNSNLLEQYIQSQGYAYSIKFDASNVKQFWTDKSVSRQDNAVKIFLHSSKNVKYESIPLRVLFKNTNASLDCKIDVFTRETGISFSVCNTKNNAVLSSSSSVNDFLNYKNLTSTTHFEDIDSSSFFLKFQSAESSEITIDAIVFSFSGNKDYLHSPGTLTVDTGDATCTPAINNGNGGNSLFPTGEITSVESNKRILVSNNQLSASVKVKNIGENAAKVYLGYVVYNKDAVLLNSRNYPYKKDSPVLKVVSVDEVNKKIVVDRYADWSKGCFIAMNAREDNSDIPNTTLLDSKIGEVKKMENGYSEITLVGAPKKKLKKDDMIRIHGSSSSNLYVGSKTLRPGEEAVLSSTIRKNDDCLLFAPESLSKGVFYVVPFIRSKSQEQNAEHTIAFENFVISY